MHHIHCASHSFVCLYLPRHPESIVQRVSEGHTGRHDDRLGEGEFGVIRPGMPRDVPRLHGLREGGGGGGGGAMEVEAGWAVKVEVD